MGKTLNLARREMGAYFYSPLAWIVGALLLAACAAVLFFGLPLLNVPRIFAPGSQASLRGLFEALAYLMVAVAPLLTMRLLSEEFRSGTIELLVTAPVSETQVILGKFLGVLGFYAVLLLATGQYLGLMALYGEPDLGVALMGYVGMLLLGMMFLSVGLFTSTLTGYQLLAALLGIALLGGFVLGTHAMMIYAPAPLNELGAEIDAMRRFSQFARGILDTRSVVYFLSIAALMLFLSVKTLESRRWR